MSYISLIIAAALSATDPVITPAEQTLPLTQSSESIDIYDPKCVGQSYQMRIEVVTQQVLMILDELNPNAESMKVAASNDFELDGYQIRMYALLLEGHMIQLKVMKIGEKGHMFWQDYEYDRSTGANSWGTGYDAPIPFGEEITPKEAYCHTLSFFVRIYDAFNKDKQAKEE